MFVPLLFGIFVTAHQGSKVSLELRGVRLETAAPILARTFGLDSLEIGPTLKNEVLLVRVKDADAETLKANIATVLHGEWLHRKEGWWLTQSDEQKNADRKTYDKDRYKFFTELVENSKKRLSELKPFDEANCKQILHDLQVLSTTKVNPNQNNFWQRIQKIERQSPMSRFAYRAALRITPDVWMKLTDENPRAVFCTKPNNMQQAFPIRVDDLIATAMQEQNQWATYAAGEPLQGPRASYGGGDEEDGGWYGMGSLNDHRQPFSTTDFSMITMSVELNNQTVEFNAYDAKGKSTFSSSVNFYEYDDAYANYNYKDEFEKLKKKMVKVTGDAAEYLDLVAPMNPYQRTNEGRKPVSPSLLAKLLHPESFDPLSIAAPDVYLGSIDTPNVVMLMNDNQRTARYPEFKDERMARYYHPLISDKDGWFLYYSPNPIANRKTMPDRKILGPLLRYMNENKRPLNLEEQAALAIQLPWEQDTSWAYQSHLSLLQSNEIEQYNSRGALRIYGAMDAGQRDRARKGGVPFSILSDQAKREVFRSIFYTQKYETRVEFDWNAQNDMTPAQRKDFNDMQQLVWGGIYEEKTFVLPNGLTNDLVITIDDKMTAQLYCGRPPVEGDGAYYGQGRTMTGTALGDYLFKCTNPQRYRWEVQSYQKIDENNIRFASERHLTMKMNISKLMFFNWSLSQTLITDPVVYTVKTLPKNILDEIQKGYKQGEENDKNYGQYYNPGGPKRSNPPPLSVMK